MTWVEKMTVLPIFVHLLDELLKEFGVDRVKAGKGFIEDDEIGIVDDGDEELDFLLHTLGKFFAFLPGYPRKFNLFEPVVDVFGEAGLRHAFEEGDIFEKFADAHFSVEASFFGEVADAVFVVEGVAAEDGDRSRIGIDDRHDHADGGAFARAVGAEEATERTGGDGELEVAHGMGLTEAFVHALNVNAEVRHGWVILSGNTVGVIGSVNLPVGSLGHHHHRRRHHHRHRHRHRHHHRDRLRRHHQR